MHLADATQLPWGIEIASQDMISTAGSRNRQPTGAIMVQAQNSATKKGDGLSKRGTWR